VNIVTASGLIQAKNVQKSIRSSNPDNAESLGLQHSPDPLAGGRSWPHPASCLWASQAVHKVFESLGKGKGKVDL